MFNIGVIGATGYIGTPYRQELRELGDEAAIRSLCARRRPLLEAAGADDGASQLTSDWREVVENPDLNLILVLTPDALHHEAVMACAEQGKHVFCEKPIGANVDEAREMCRAYRESGLAHFVPFWTRYVPVVARAREIVRSGALGEVRGVVYRWHNPRPKAMPFTWRDDAELSSAGSIADVGSHAYDAMRWMLGDEATGVLAHAGVVSPAKPDLGAINLDEALQQGEAGVGGDKTRMGTAFDYASIAFQFAGGAVGTLVLSHAYFIRRGMAPEIELHGSDASLAVNRGDNSLTIVRQGGEAELLETVPDPGPGNRFAQHVLPALRAMIEGRPSGHPSLEDGYRVQLFTDAAARSARQRNWVDLR